MARDLQPVQVIHMERHSENTKLLQGQLTTPATRDGKLTIQGFVPVVLRAFPTNAAALAVWEGVMRWSAKNDVQF
jgi:solute carrier family 25 carnitine/acylcarnitine transporter 20/29